MARSGRNIAFIDLAEQQRRIKDRIDARIAAVLAHGQYILGPEVAELEAGLAELCGVRHALTCANGTDALQLGLMALGAGPGDAIFVPTFTFAATAEVVPFVGAIPFFVDVRADTFNLDPASLERAIAAARAQGLNPCGVVPVDLFGLPADYDEITRVATRHDMWVMADSAQGFGATYRGRRSGAIGNVATTSFFPAKPLGCYGDGGAIFTDDDGLADRLRSYRFHGKGTHKYDNARIGVNSRLDTLQAAILLPKLAIYADEIQRRQAVAERYTVGLQDVVKVPSVPPRSQSVWAQYTLTLDPGVDREGARAHLTGAGVPTAVYYPRPLHLQTAYRDFPGDPAGMPVSEAAAARVLSLPMHPYLEPADQDYIIEQVRSALAASKR